MKQLFFLICTLFLLVSCKQFNNGKTNKPLPIDTMKIIVWEMITAEELNNMIMVQDTLQRGKRLNQQFYQEIFRKHQVTKEQYYQSLAYFDARPDKMKILIDSVSAYAERKKQKAIDDRIKKKK